MSMKSFVWPTSRELLLLVHFNGIDGLYKSASVPMVEMERWKTDYGFDWFQATAERAKGLDEQVR